MYSYRFENLTSLKQRGRVVTPASVNAVVHVRPVSAAKYSGCVVFVFSVASFNVTVMPVKSTNTFITIFISRLRVMNLKIRYSCISL